ncbi:hypothetical protein HMPREF1247_1406 [Atopobium sp. BV3Ac4]|nr:hypothetical protein HMPREF1247_1406 [Atopobium sp. BV3Ac4]
MTQSWIILAQQQRFAKRKTLMMCWFRSGAPKVLVTAW